MTNRPLGADTIPQLAYESFGELSTIEAIDDVGELALDRVGALSVWIDVECAILLIIMPTIRPPTITMANGRSESEPMPAGKRCGKQPQRSHQRGYHDRTKSPRVTNVDGHPAYSR